jgi:glycosyltransferase involved in cell wall biosynthesis
VIAPPAGGPLELVTHGCEGFLVDGRQTDKLVAAVNSLRTNLPLYKTMAENALQKAATFSPEQFGRSVQAVFGTNVSATGNATNRKNIPAFGKSAMA